ncbi:hypothetical protein GCM10010251_47490 [Streptomyces aurantiogriseus]|uniref:Uncharacterized protein n=1 Tax=Streptomyces aurantiogriseus TaxID=66870 RepID=A0A918CK77_9ACTN|nr:hypothetical protein GCM10010251_47490 [Streptomyces aurantiogriseus]
MNPGPITNQLVDQGFPHSAPVARGSWAACRVRSTGTGSPGTCLTDGTSGTRAPVPRGTHALPHRALQARFHRGSGAVHGAVLGDADGGVGVSPTPPGAGEDMRSGPVGVAEHPVVEDST